MYAGIAVIFVNDIAEVGLSIHDGTYSIDFSVENFPIPPDAKEEDMASVIEKYVIDQLNKFSSEHLVKFVGAGLTEGAEYHCPKICGKIWADLDIVPLVFHV